MIYLTHKPAYVTFLRQPITRAHAQAIMLVYDWQNEVNHLPDTVIPEVPGGVFRPCDRQSATVADTAAKSRDETVGKSGGCFLSSADDFSAGPWRGHASPRAGKGVNGTKAYLSHRVKSPGKMINDMGRFQYTTIPESKRR